MTRKLFLTLLLVFPLSLHAVGFGGDLKDMEGATVDLFDYVGQGKWVLLMFWASDCQVCDKEFPIIAGFHKDHKDKDAIVLGVALDGYEKKPEIQAFMERHSAGFTTLFGNRSGVTYNYYFLTHVHFKGTPTFLLFSPDGELVGNNPGPVRPESIENFMAQYLRTKEGANVPAR